MKLYQGDYDNYVRTIEFYQLKIGDYFRLGRMKYKKISEDFAEDIDGAEKFFWPQDTVRLLSPVEREKLWEKYPITEYLY